METERITLPPRRARPFAIAALLGLTLAACAGVTGPTSSGSGSPRDGTPAPSAHGLLLRVEQVGGFIAPQALLQRYPQFSLFADGTVITVGAQIQIYPQPALPPLIATHVSPAAVQAIMRAAAQDGLQRTVSVAYRR